MKVSYITNIHGDLNKLRLAIAKARNMNVSIFINGGDFCGGYSDFNKWIEQYRDVVKTATKKSMAFIQTFGETDNYYQFTRDENFPGKSLGYKYHALHDGALYIIEGLEIFSIPYVSDTRFMISNKQFNEDSATRDFMPHPKIEFNNGQFATQRNNLQPSDLSTILQQFAPTMNLKKSIGVIHNPPAKTCISKDFNLIDRGSMVIRDYIQKHEPFLVFTGHVTNQSIEDNESNFDTVGRTLCINPGFSNMIILDYKSIVTGIPVIETVKL